MFRKLLVAVDLSSHNEDVFSAGLDLAKRTGASVLLVYVLSSEAPESPTVPTFIGTDYYPASGSASVMEIYNTLWRTYEEKGFAMLKGFAEKARQAGVTIEYTQQSGSPGKVICDLANTIDADLVIVGRRGYSGLNEFIMGSVSNYVTHHAPCSVLLVQYLDLRSAPNPERTLVSTI
jgi:nucleotide-binding universal stress UspA family protein